MGFRATLNHLTADPLEQTKECVFCNIIRRRLPAEILYENEKTIAILDINPIHHGHTLVIPKNHCPDLLTLPSGDLHDVMDTTQLVARALVEALQPDAFNVFSNNGRTAGQSVFHFHMHVIPRFRNDAVRFIHQLKTYPDGAMEDYARRIRAGLPHSAAVPE